MNAVILLTLIVLIMLGVPVAVSLGIASVVGLEAFTTLPLLVVAQRMFTGIDSFPLMAVPLFILAGNLMAAGLGAPGPRARWSEARAAVSPAPASSPA